MAELVEFHGMPAVRWRSRDGSAAIATLQGAQLVSWTPSCGEECLYLSERSPFEAGRPIRGGIPIVFPQFGTRGPLAQHGFARTQAWSFVGASESGGSAQASFALESSPQTEALWPGAFRLVLAVTIGGPRLDVELRVANPGNASLTFTAALHTYLRVSGPAARLEGLREVVTAGEAIDRVYVAAPAATHLMDAGRILRIEQRGFTDTVVWNPGRERTARMADMPPDGFRHMLCVEAAAIEPPVVVAPGETWCGGQSITLGDRSP